SVAGALDCGDVKSVVLVVCACVVALLAFAWSRGDAAAATPSGEASTGGAATAAAAPSGGPAEPAARERVDAAGALDAAQATQRVRVVATLADGEPAASADVRYWPTRSAKEREGDAAERKGGKDLE